MVSFSTQTVLESKTPRPINDGARKPLKIMALESVSLKMKTAGEQKMLNFKKIINYLV
jgi:hypothetical protein